MVAIDHLRGQMYCQYGMVAGIAVNYDISMLYIYTLYMAIHGKVRPGMLLLWMVDIW